MFYITTQIQVWVKSQSCSIINVPSCKTQVAPGTLSQQVVNSKLWKASAKWHVLACSIFVLENFVFVDMSVCHRWISLNFLWLLESCNYAEISLKCKTSHLLENATKLNVKCLIIFAIFSPDYLICMLGCPYLRNFYYQGY